MRQSVDGLHQFDESAAEPHRVPFFRPDAELGTRLFQGIIEGLVPRVSMVVGVT